MKRTYLFFLAAILGLGTAVPVSADTIVLQTNFQAPGTAPGTHLAGSDVGAPNGFAVEQGSVTALPCAFPAAGQCLQFNAGDAALFSNSSFGPSGYKVDLELAGGSVTSGVRVQLQTGNFQVFTVSANSTFAHYFMSTNIDAGNNARLEITGGGGVLLNTVTLSQTDMGAAVPEPAAWSLMIAAGLAGIEAKRRHRL